MNTRRSFLKGLLLGAVVPLVFTPSLIKPTWKDTLKYGTKFKDQLIPNPEWKDAPYEVVFLFDKSKSLIDNTHYLIDAYPLRYDENKNPVRPFIIRKEPC